MTDVGVQTMLVSHTCPGSSLLRLQSFKRRSDSELYHISYDIATDTVGSALDANFISDKSCIHSATMRRVLTQFLKEQHQVLEKIIEDLNGESWDESDIDVMFMAIADQVFVDGKCNWGRIVALHGFVYKLVESVRKTEGKIVATSYAEKLSQLLAAYLSGSLAHWICAVGGWNNFTETFTLAEADRNSRPFWSRMWTTLGIGLGLGITGIFVASKV